jgi:mRNA interferase MazF
MASNSAQRGEVWTASLGAAKSGELGKSRPVIIMAIDEIMTDSDDELLIVVPLSASRSESSMRPMIPAGKGIERDSVAVIRGARAIARSRLLSKVTQLDPVLMQQITMLLTAVIGGQPQLPVERYRR